MPVAWAPDPTPIVLITGPRVGGTLLSHCLSTHPQVFFARGEPLSGVESWARLKVAPVVLLDVLLHMSGYCASGCRLMYSQLHQPDVWGYLQTVQPKVIWLCRANLLEQAFSLMTYERERPAHSFESVCPPSVEVQPRLFLNAVRNLIERNDAAGKKMLAFRDVYCLLYEAIVPDERGYLPEGVATELCRFIGVRIEPMRCDLKRINRPLPEAIANWPEVQKAVEASEFSHYLEGVRHVE